MPEQAISTAKDICVVSGRIILITGVPKSLDIPDCIPNKFKIEFVISVVVMLSVEPISLRIVEGSGIGSHEGGGKNCPRERYAG